MSIPVFFREQILCIMLQVDLDKSELKCWKLYFMGVFAVVG